MTILRLRRYLASAASASVWPCPAFFATAFVERMPVQIHTAILDAAVITGGLVMISAAARQLIAG